MGHPADPGRFERGQRGGGRRGGGPLALGSDGGGSVRVPAALCGLVGFKASMGRVPVYPGCRDERLPGVSGWESLEHIGPLARTVADIGLALSVLAGPDPRDRHSIPCGDVDWRGAVRRGAGEGIAGLRIAYSPDLGYLAVDPEVRRVVDAAASVFGDPLGCEVERVEPGWADPGDAFAALIMADTDLRGMRALVAEHGEAMSPHLRAMLARAWTAEEFTDAEMVRKGVVNRMARLMARYDLLLTPTSCVPAFPVGIEGPATIAGRPVPPTAWTGFCAPANLTGQPALSLPAGRTGAGLPRGPPARRPPPRGCHGPARGGGLRTGVTMDALAARGGRDAGDGGERRTGVRWAGRRGEAGRAGAEAAPGRSRADRARGRA
ncbi:aspartyl-tRNA(Asn)/glutamyl-tRNA(Gln) amidotransferase subunit A, partial [Streptomyces sp. SolWspMP-sol7th]